jgi:hypothetical protein
LQPGWTSGLVLALGLWIAGCTPIAWTRVTRQCPEEPNDVAFIVAGKTKWGEVIKKLGAPNDLVKEPEGAVVANYYYYDGRHFGVDFGWPLGFFGPAAYAPHNMDFENSGIGADTFQVSFDANGTVQYEGFSHTASVARFKPSPFKTAIP